jgi:hypothetical protein
LSCIYTKRRITVGGRSGEELGLQLAREREERKARGPTGRRSVEWSRGGLAKLGREIALVRRMMYGVETRSSLRSTVLKWHHRSFGVMGETTR